MQVSIISSNEIITTFLSDDQKHFLEIVPRAQGDDKGIPLFVRNGDDFHFLAGIKMATSFNKDFNEKAPDGLYRGGVVIMVTYQGGVLVVPDDRYHWFKSFAGIANYDEGDDLKKAGLRELLEEAFVYDLSKTTRFVPIGSNLQCSRYCWLGFTVEKIVEVGEIKQINYAINEKNRAYEAVLQWGLDEIGKDISVAIDEDWWSGGHPGFPVYVMNMDGSIRGIFSGQQGFQTIPDFGKHPTLEVYLKSVGE